MNSSEKLQLQDMLKEGHCVDNTDTIRQLKHSALITRDVNTLLKMKKNMDSVTFEKECMSQCSFLFENYTNIYNKLIKDELNLTIFYQFLHHLKKIEDGELTYYDASYQIGCLLKQLYVDPLVDNDKKNDKNTMDVRMNVKERSISWNEYKNINHI